MRRYLRNRLPEKSTRLGLLVIAGVVAVGLWVPADRLREITEAWRELENLLTALGFVAILIPEKK